MSIEYTAEDFAKASFARHVGGRTAARTDDPGVASPWRSISRSAGLPRWMTDEEMALRGWVPVVEASQAVAERAEQKRRAQADHIAVIERALRDRNKTIDDLQQSVEDLDRRLQQAVWARDEEAEGHRSALRERDQAQAAVDDLHQEIDRLERILQAPLRMRDLEVAWEAAEVPTASTGIREGDVCIELCADHHFEVFRASVGVEADGAGGGAIRILSRAPKREPWADLADIIGRYDGDSDSPAELARFLHENEVTTPFDHDAGRVTGGEEAEK